MRNVLIILIFIFGMFFQIAYASDCWDNKISFESAESINKSIQNIDTILVGEVLEKISTEYETKEIPKFTSNSDLRFSIYKIIKSNAKEQKKIINIRSSIGKNCQCDFDFEVGSIYLIYALLPKVNKDEYRLKYCNSIKKIENASEDLKMLKDVLSTNK